MTDGAGAERGDWRAELSPAVARSLCAGCRWVRAIRSGRGSLFLLCRRAQDDSRFERYPPQPRMVCEGFEA